MKSVLTFFYLGLATGRIALASDFPTSVEPWDLKRAAAYAIDHAPAVQSAAESLKVAQAQESIAFGTLLPEADIKTLHGLESTGISVPGAANTFVLPSGNWVSQSGLYFTENLYENGTSFTKYRVSKITTELQRLTLKNARDQLLLTLVKAFQQYTLDLKSLEVQEEQYKLIERQYKSADLQHHEGFKTKQDVIRFRVDFQSAQIARVNAHEQVKRSARDIVDALGIAGAVDPASNEGAIFKPLDFERFPDQVPAKAIREEDTVDTRLARMQIDVSQGDVDIARRALWPELTVTAGADYASSNYIDNNPYNPAVTGWQWSVLVNLNYTLWDWGQKRGAETVAIGTQRKAEYDWRQKLVDTHRTLTNLMMDLARLSEVTKESDELRHLQDDNNRYIEQQYRDGKTDYINLIDSLRTLLQARLDYYTNVRDLLQNIAQYRYFEGTIYDSINNL